MRTLSRNHGTRLAMTITWTPIPILDPHLTMTLPLVRVALKDKGLLLQVRVGVIVRISVGIREVGLRVRGVTTG